MSDADPRNLLDDLIARARRAGADAADALMVESASLSLARRLGKPEKLERAESQDLGLRVLIGKRQAIVSSSDRAPAILDELVERAVAMARSVPEDPYCGLASPDEIDRHPPQLELCDPAEPTPEALAERASAAEEAARAIPGVTNSEGAEAGWSRSRVAMAASNGFAGAYEGSRHGVSVSVIAGNGTGMERDYDYSSAVFEADLADAAEVGRKAGERAVARLGPRKVATTKVPVVFDPRVSGGLLGHLAGGINGNAIARGTSFLKDKLGQQVMASGLTVTDDPYRARGLRSRPFAGEGIACRRRDIVADGVLTTWVLDLRSARQLGLHSTGHAGRGTSSPPSPGPTNLFLAPGTLSRDALIGGIDRGFYVTELIGFGVNGITGDYSRGAAGFWIERGELTYPVEEITIAGSLPAMFRGIEMVGNDLVFRNAIAAPTLKIERMTVAGA